MKDTEIHTGLVQKELRDFISLAIVKNLQSESENQLNHIPMGDLEINDWVIRECDSEIQYFQEKKQIYSERFTLITMINMNNWKEHDVSDDVIKNTSYKFKMNFIGTDEEYKILIEKIKKEEIKK